MTVAEFVQTDFTTQNASSYKTNIDGAFAVLKHIAQSGACHAEDPNSDKVKVDAIERFDGGTIKKQSQQTSPSISFPSSEDRIDRVVFDEQDLSVSVVTGTEASSPSAPSIPDGNLPCAQIRLSPSDTSISNDQITDERKAFLFYAVDSDSATDAQNVTQTYKGNDIDSDGDGQVDSADDSDQYDGVDPSDGTNGQVYTTDGTNGGFEDVNLSNSIGTNSGNFHSEEVSQTIGGGNTETVNVEDVNGYVEGNASVVDNSGNPGDDVEQAPAGTTTNANGNLNGLRLENTGNSGQTMTVRFFGVVE